MTSEKVRGLVLQSCVSPRSPVGGGRDENKDLRKSMKHVVRYVLAMITEKQQKVNEVIPQWGDADDE